MPPNFFMIPGNPGLSTHYNALVPGSSIPEWFIHLSEECSVTVELPPHWYKYQVDGIGYLCCFNANITMGELGEFVCCSVKESIFTYITSK